MFATAAAIGYFENLPQRPNHPTRPTMASLRGRITNQRNRVVASLGEGHTHDVDGRPSMPPESDEMTDSPDTHERPVVRRPSKRERLVAAASQLLKQQSVEKTRLVDIAQLADVPVGNVYYYFKTKDEIVETVTETHVRDVQAEMASLERRYHCPKARLKALIGALAGKATFIAQRGCPDGRVSAELDKDSAGLEPQVGKLLAIPIDWAEQQFRMMGRDDARDLAVSLIASCQGIAVVANTLRDPKLLNRQGRRLAAWIDALETT
jgi:AcrR family transcriptional regulator